MRYAVCGMRYARTLLWSANTEVEKLQRRMPPFALLEPVVWLPGTELGMFALRAYQIVGAILLVIKALQICPRDELAFRVASTKRGQ
jgi:hypothetical protein